jgi:hypothetical protein
MERPEHDIHYKRDGTYREHDRRSTCASFALLPPLFDALFALVEALKRFLMMFFSDGLPALLMLVRRLE